jgi:hypothetical protein
VRNVADLTSDDYFNSEEEPRPWIYWDFHGMRVSLTHYTIRSWLLKSWVVENSLDGVNWTEIDQKTDREDFLGVSSLGPLRSRLLSRIPLNAVSSG